MDNKLARKSSIWRTYNNDTDNIDYSNQTPW
jgi:hypothetical protein